jgi:hypothetical protein
VPGGLHRHPDPILQVALYYYIYIVQAPLMISSTLRNYKVWMIDIVIEMIVAAATDWIMRITGMYEYCVRLAAGCGFAAA